MITTEIMLTALSVTGALACLFAGFFALRPLHRANGSSALIQAIIFLSIIGFIWAGILCYNSMTAPDTLPDSGLLLMFSIYARIKAILIAVTLVFMVVRLKRAIAEHDAEKNGFTVIAGEE